MRANKGFTLIEMLIVILVIGILAVIAIPQFATTREKTFDGASRSDLRNLMTAMEAYFSEQYAYTGTTIASGGRADLDGDGTADAVASVGVTLQATAYSDGYEATAAHSSSTRTWCVNSSAANASGQVGVITVATSC